MLFAKFDWLLNHLRTKTKSGLPFPDEQIFVLNEAHGVSPNMKKATKFCFIDKKVLLLFCLQLLR